MWIITKIKPMDKPKEMPVRPGFDMETNRTVVWLGMLVIAITIVLYIIFW